jgi:phage terminase small subunit
VARARDPKRDQAYELWKQSGGTAKLKDIADQLGVSEGTVRGWKKKDQWEERLNGTFQSTERSAPKNTERSNGTERSDPHVSWAEIENEYVTDIRRKPCTLKELAEKYGVPLQTVKEYAARNQWTEKRNQHRTNVIQKTAEKTAELVSSDIARVTARHLRLSDKLLAVIEEALQDEKQFYRYVEKIRTGYGPGEFDEKVQVEVLDSLNEAKLLNTVAALEKLQKMQRQTLGILDERDRRKLEIYERKNTNGIRQVEKDGERQDVVRELINIPDIAALVRNNFRRRIREGVGEE